MRNPEKDELEMAARKEAMLSEGFRLFAAKGIEAVPMQEIADAAGIGIATLYRYYNTKLALVLDIGTRKWEEYGAYAAAMRAERHADRMNAAEELDFYLGFYIDLYQNHKDLLRFNQNFNNFVQHEGATKEQLMPYVAAISGIGKLFHSVYEKGKRDGSIRTDMPEEKMFASTAHIMLAVGVRYAQGLLFSAENEADRTEEFELVKRMILREYVLGGQ
jgi:AcrR family transcriptional regulator